MTMKGDTDFAPSLEQRMKAYEREQGRRIDPSIPECEHCGDSGHMVWTERYDEFQCIKGSCVSKRLQETARKIGEQQ